MEYSDIASVAGKGGLFKVIKPTRTGVILESLDDARKKLIANATQRISVLSDISIYTTDQEGSTPLPDIFKTIFDEFEDDPGIDSNSDTDELKAFLKHVLPEYDEQRVYPSDIKKLVSWYKILLKEAPELIKNGNQDASAESTDQ
ncbi:DUF5606 domain-containing protein [Fulvivirga sedimenti]|uniref:DUF5606 domain-containing protein n=1 Tax=Fulvivirga sedimenti TaxID=2879465 RepID=A0A9X1L0P9_9BACT|nr:DUF5606 domain-containing protein [Fulvivirga sedimenti]MCA6078004.1 DUF5606 domain-containing protein [Fulvivirga sedimenti]